MGPLPGNAGQDKGSPGPSLLWHFYRLGSPLNFFMGVFSLLHLFWVIQELGKRGSQIHTLWLFIRSSPMQYCLFNGICLLISLTSSLLQYILS